MIHEKMGPCLSKLEPGFWTYGWISLADPTGPNVVSRHQAPRSINFLRFHNFNGFFSWFSRKWGLVCGYWSQGSGIMAGYVLWAQLAQMQFLGPRPKDKIFIEISWIYWICLMIPEKMRSYLWKMEPGFWTYGVITPLPRALGPNCPKLVFRDQTTNVRVFGSENFSYQAP